jgi:cytoskeletal protein CcmA (bactofilin family)
MLPKTDKGDQVGRTAPSSLSTRRVPKDAAPSLVSADLEVDGNLTADGALHIDGIVEGDVRCKQLTVGESAVLAGKITADEIEVHGRVEGSIHARSVHLTKTAEIVGDIWHDSLSIDSGAFLNGHCRRNDSAPEMGETPTPGTASPGFISEARARRHEPDEGTFH